MAPLAKQVIGTNRLRVVADRGYCKGEEILACNEPSITTYRPKLRTSGSAKKGMFGKRDSIYHTVNDEYECPDDKRLVPDGRQ
tara:strand:- start:7705 stop:7953 length:249 start_codon:yes stop_codon:yes gene_type:complete